MTPHATPTSGNSGHISGDVRPHTGGAVNEKTIPKGRNLVIKPSYKSGSSFCLLLSPGDGSEINFLTGFETRFQGIKPKYCAGTLKVLQCLKGTESDMFKQV